MGAHRGPLLAVLAALTLGACATSPYRESVDAWTRKSSAYDQFDVTTLVAATLGVEPFRKAYADEYARLFALTPEQKVSLQETLGEEDRRALVVIVAFYTAQTAWNDLNPARGIWEVRLESPRGDTAQPYSVTRIDKRNPTWKALFPYLEAHDTLYELRFERNLPDGRPLARSGEDLELVIAGAPARTRLRWTIP